MRLLLGATAMVLALSSTPAQGPTPAASPAPGTADPAPAEPAATPEATSPPSPLPADNAKMKEEVNLAETPGADDFTIAPPADEPDADTAPAVTGALEGDEETSPLPAVTGTIDVTAKDQSKVVRAAVGNLLRIVLESNPSTGYNWELRDFDYGVAVFHRSELVARKDTGNVLFGAPADTVITIQAVKPGTQDITLVYRRQWEPPDQVEATFAFRLEVGGEQAAPNSSPATPTAP